jgi:hypothetical protein
MAEGAAIAPLLEIFKACDETHIQFTAAEPPPRQARASWTVRKVDGGFEIGDSHSESRRSMISLLSDLLRLGLASDQIAALDGALPGIARVQRDAPPLEQPPRPGAGRPPRGGPPAEPLSFALPPLVREPWRPPPAWLFADVEGTLCTVTGPPERVAAVRARIRAILADGGVQGTEDTDDLSFVVQ